jgi:hypothetical protein
MKYRWIKNNPHLAEMYSSAKFLSREKAAATIEVLLYDSQ